MDKQFTDPSTSELHLSNSPKSYTWSINIWHLLLGFYYLPFSPEIQAKPPDNTHAQDAPDTSYISNLKLSF